MTNKGNRKRKVVQNPNDVLIYGKVEPNHVELEGAVLGAIMVEMDSLYKVKTILSTPNMLYSDANQRIYRAILELDRMGSPYDFMIVCEHLRRSEELDIVGGSYYVISLTRDIVSSANIIEHAMYISQSYLSREMIRISIEIVNRCYDPTELVFGIMDDFEMAMKTSRYAITAGSTQTYESKVRRFVEHINDPEKRKNYYVSTGFPDLDRELGGGWLRGATTILAARTSMGKTSFIISATDEQSKHFPVSIWNGELTERRFIMRQVSKKERLTISEMNKEDVSDEILDRINTGAHVLMNEHQLFTDDTTPIMIEDLIAKIRYWVVCCGVQCVYLDYLRYITLPESYRYDRMTEQMKITEIMGRLNSVAKELDIPIILVQQLNRETEKNANKEPTLANLRDAGALEEMAACVVFLYRPEHYKIESTEDMTSTKDLGLVLIRKNGDNKNPVDVKFKTEAKYFTWRTFESDYGEEIIEGTGITHQDIKDKLGNEEVPF